MNKWHILLAHFVLYCIILFPNILAEAASQWEFSFALGHPVIADGVLYGVDHQGIVSVDLRQGKEKVEIPKRAMDLLNEEEEHAPFFVADGKIFFLDVSSSTIWAWEENKFIQRFEINPAIMFQERLPIRFEKSQNVLWMENGGRLFSVDWATGVSHFVNMTGILAMGSRPDGGLVTIVQNDEVKFVYHITSATGEGKWIAELPAGKSSMVAVDSLSGTVYAVVDGMLCRLGDDGKWMKLRPVSETPFLTGCGVWEDKFVLIARNQVTLMPMMDDGVTVLSVRGGNGKLSGDLQFMAEHPQIGIQRITGAATAEDVYRAILSKDETVDLFCIRAGYGMKALIDKGYAASEALDPLIEDVERMHPFLRNALMRQGKLFAYPEYVFTMNSWWRSKGYEDVKVPATLSELLDFYQAWEKQGESLHAVARSGISSGWSRLDFGRYAITQWILTHDLSDLKFSDSPLEQLLQQLSFLPPAMEEVWTDELVNAVLMDSETTDLTVQDDAYADLTMAPQVTMGSDVAYLANISVYMVNPYSTHVQEAITFLQYMGSHRGERQLPLLYEGVQPSRDQHFNDILDDLIQQEQEAQRALEQAGPAEKRDREDELAKITEMKKAYLSSGRNWDYSPEDLALFQSHYAPRIRLVDSPLLSSEKGIFSGLWQNVEEVLKMCLDGQISPADCLRRMDELWSMYQKENP